MYRSIGVVCLCAFLTFACGEETPSPSDAPAEVVSGDTGLTGVLDEDEFARLHEMKAGEAPAAKGETVELSDGSRAYLSLPEGARAPVPGVIVIQEWWGLNGHIKHWADRLAADGYAAIAVDLYGGKVATEPQDAMALMKEASAAPETSRATLAAAYDFLERDERVRAPRIASIGWCFGGAQSLSAALSLEGLDGAVIYYGRLVTDPERLRAIRAEVLGVFGNQDRGIPPEVVSTFESALGEAGVTHRILRYDANHAFANPSSARYDAESAAAAWKEVSEFLARILRG